MVDVTIKHLTMVLCEKWLNFGSGLSGLGWMSLE